MNAYPEWLHVLAWLALLLGFASAGIILFFVDGLPNMRIMRIVWPISGLYLGGWAIGLYRKSMQKAQSPGAPDNSQSPRALDVFTAVCHCGAGCVLGDLIGETVTPALGLSFAGTFASKLLIDFFFAYLLGILFQFYSIVPMRGLSVGRGIVAAIRADTISIAAFEIGMFGWMALERFVLFSNPPLRPYEAVFWFMMQIAMIVGFFTAFPANAWLLRKGWKEKM